jgi:hypothetical protein
MPKALKAHRALPLHGIGDLVNKLTAVNAL